MPTHRPAAPAAVAPPLRNGLRAGRTLVGVVAWAWLAAVAQAKPLDDEALCATPGGVSLLAPATIDDREARAIWIDGERLRWAAPEAAAQVLLLGSTRAALRLTAGQSPGGMDWWQPLRPAEDLRWPATDRRFSHVQGTLFTLPAALPRTAWRDQIQVVALDADGRLLAHTGVQLAGALDALFSGAAGVQPLGAIRYANGTRFALWAPTAQRVALCLFDAPASDGAEPAVRAVVALAPDTASGVWQAVLPAAGHGQRYAYLVDVLVPGAGLARNRTTDPYALGLTADSRHAVVLDLAHPSTQPAGWGEDRRPDRVEHATDLVLYELHVRDFTRDDASVPAADRGKYLGFTHSGSDGMRHLRTLSEAGVTDVHLLPTYDLASVPERGCVEPALPAAGATDEAVQAAVAEVRSRDCFNWGYDPWHYTVPEGSYASTADDATARVREFRAMVQALHAAGLRVGLDVVYNHTMAAGQDAQSVLDRIVPGYYHRLDANGAVETSTCCPNTATEATMMARLMIDSAVVWARDYRIDSFRFDLMGHQPREAMLRLQRAVDSAAGRRIHLVGEGWNFGEVRDGARFVQASQQELGHSGIATFSDRLRDAARGGRAGDRGDALFQQGWLSGLHLAPNTHARKASSATSARALADAATQVRVGLAGTLREVRIEGADGRLVRLADLAYGDQPAGYVAEPGEVVNYTENHDNLTLFDSNTLRLPLDTPHHERARVQVLGNALVLLSQGIAYLHAGQEILRSKSLDRNSYDSGDAFNRIDWRLTGNGFGIGLPPAWDNAPSWPQMRIVLARADAIAPRPEDIAFTLGATLDLLRIRRENALLRLRDGAEVQQRLRLLGTDPALLVGRIDGHAAGKDGSNLPSLLYALNTDPAPRAVVLPKETGASWTLHPLHTAPEAADARARQARFDAASGTLTVPGRTAVVFLGH